jgi:hypothetical protein
MKTVSLQTQIDADGKLRLEVPCDLPPGPAEVVLVIQPAASGTVNSAETGVAGRQLHRARSGLFVGKAPKDFDVDAALDEMNKEWKEKLMDLQP